MGLLQIKGLSIRFGGIAAITGFDLECNDNEIVGIIGPNGAGKSTLFNCICRLYEPSEGSMLFQGKNLLKYGPHDLARLGIARTFQNLEVFNKLTVLENVLIGRHCRFGSGLWSEVLGLSRVNREEKIARQEVEALLEVSGLGSEKDREVAGLPYGKLKMVELARALALQPRLLLLDEPSAGMSAEEIANMRQVLLELREKRGISILLVAHHLGLVMTTCERVVVLNFGEKIAEGAPGEVARDKAVLEAYIGKKTYLAEGASKAE